jgi:hypothetical protein
MSGKIERARAPILQAPTPEAVVAYTEGVIKFMQLGYAAWMAAYLILGILSIGLPGLAAMGLFGAKTNQALAGAGALVAAIFTFLKPHEYATGFDNAAQLAWKTLNDFQLGAIDNVDVAKQLGHALALTTFRYGATSHAPHNVEPPNGA